MSRFTSYLSWYSSTSSAFRVVMLIWWTGQTALPTTAVERRPIWNETLIKRRVPTRPSRTSRCATLASKYAVSTADELLAGARRLEQDTADEKDLSCHVCTNILCVIGFSYRFKADLRALLLPTCGNHPTGASRPYKRACCCGYPPVAIATRRHPHSFGSSVPYRMQ